MSQPSELPPLKAIPGSYGHRFFGPYADRFDYFYRQGTEEFFRSRVNKYGSTVFRVNMPPGPFVSPDPKVVVVLDATSFPVLFDTSKVEKRNVLDGTFMPSTDYMGGTRVCAFLDPSEPSHTANKRFIFYLLHSWHDTLVPLFRNSMQDFFVRLDDAFSAKGEAYFNSFSDQMSFDFILRLFCRKDPSETSISYKTFDKWLFLQLSPLITTKPLKILDVLEDLLLHTFPLPTFLVKSDYKKMYEVFYASNTEALGEAEKLGLGKKDACNNLVFLAGFSAYGGMKTTFPALIKWIGKAGEGLHRQLAEEIRTVVRSEGGVTLGALEKMPLTKSVVYEALRMEPPVPFQYGKAKEDIIIHSSDGSAYEIKKGEMIFGYQPFATRDPNVFKRAEEFVGDRFVGPEGEKMLRYVYWSNGRETENPTVENKQCPGKDMVVLLCRVMVVEFFLRYDTFMVESGTLALGSTVTFKSLSKATSH
ncbi:hypothetical protein MLD38_030938 [Melastoma candidum]|uniref:Uncharacterized protein n=1 Tax=Melastoma candidum TaxID=119954 RepID=A0ACB9MN61_9MYRT|nr:hypothetical protein MLD38_030938 [Melastoma candidum]